MNPQQGPEDTIMNNTTEFVNELYDKMSYLDMYGSTVVLFIALTLFIFCIYTYLQAIQKREALVNDWTNQRCNPKYIPFAGYINAPDGKTAFEYTGENFQFCMQNILVNITGNIMKPFELLLVGITNFFVMLSGTINQIRTVLSVLRDNVTNFVKEILNRLLITIIPLQTIMIKVMDMFKKIQGVMMASLYTMLGSYLTLKSLMGAMMELIIRVMVIMTIIIFGLWAAGPMAWPLAASSSAAYIAISIPLALVLYFMSDVLHIKTSAIPKLRRCFDANTLIKMYDGTLKKISEVEPGQLMENGVKITSKFKVDASNLKMYKLHDIIVSETHIVKYNRQWIQIAEHPDATPIKNGIYNKPFLYCLNTNSKEITINGTVFADWDELYEKELELVLKFISDNNWGLNPNDRENIHKYLEVGFDADTNVYLNDNTKINIKDIKIGDKLSTKGTVYGIVEILNSKGKEKVFHLLTTNKLFEIDGKIIRDYNDHVDSVCQSIKSITSKSHFSIQLNKK